MVSIVALMLAGGLSGVGVSVQAPVSACALLTKELALKVTSAPSKQVFNLLPPQEEKIGTTGSACEYADIRVQIVSAGNPQTFK